MTGLCSGLCIYLFLVYAVCIAYCANPATDVRPGVLNVEHGPGGVHISEIIEDNCQSIIGKKCACQFSNGSTIDLHGIGNPDGKKWRFDYKQHQFENYFYAFNPCYPMKGLTNVTENKFCKDAVLCQHAVADTNIYFNLGEAENESFGTKSGVLVVMYTATTSAEIPPQTRISTIQLICDPSLSEPTFEVISNTDLNYEFKMTAKQCCLPVSGGLSFGTILCITFILAVLVYLVVGVAINKFARGATGLELVPNRSFWVDVPSLVKEGFVFTASKIGGCISKDSEYDSI